MNVYEAKDGQEYVVEGSLPGVKPENIAIAALDDYTLNIRCTMRSEERVEKT